MSKETKPESFQHKFSVGGQSITAKAEGDTVIFEPAVTTPGYMEKLERACREILLGVGLGGTVEAEGKTVKMTCAKHEFTKDELKGFEHYFQPLEAHVEPGEEADDAKGNKAVNKAATAKPHTEPAGKRPEIASSNRPGKH